MKYRTIILFVCLLLTYCAPCQERLQTVLDSLRIAGNFPGLSMAIASNNQDVIALTSGWNYKESKIPLRTSDMLL